jgi:hypothetical protein
VLRFDGLDHLPASDRVAVLYTAGNHDQCLNLNEVERMDYSQDVVPITFKYRFTPDFKQYLRKHRPEAAKVLETKGIEEADVNTTLTPMGDFGRFILSFPSIPYEGASDFDRSSGYEYALIVLDHHPAKLAAWREVKPIPLVEGTTGLMDPEYVNKRLPVCRAGIPVRVLEQEAYILHCETIAEGFKFYADSDEVRIWQLFWKGEDKQS